MNELSFNHAIDHAGACLIVVDNKMVIKNVNRVCCDTIKCDKSYLINQSCTTIFRDSLLPTQCILQTLDQGIKKHLPRTAIYPESGIAIPITLSTFPVLTDGKIEGAILIFNSLENYYPSRLCNFQKLGLVAQSPQMQNVFQLIETVAPTDSSILIQGQTGTGKELVANAIHMLSARSEMPFVKVNCASLSENLLESEMFGHEKGSFTGAYAKRVGRFEMANQGTLFLDEISEISTRFQAKLLRVLQEGELERVGASETISTNVRIITATNRNMRHLVDKGRFREDLYYRINVFPIDIPLLIERENDLRLLMDYMISKNNLSFTKQIEGVSAEAGTILDNYSFPGNVRELKNIIEYAFIKAEGNLITDIDLPPYIRKSAKKTKNSLPLRQSVNDKEIALILDTISRYEGNKTKAAVSLGISRKTLYNKLNKKM